uniref:Beta,beta-carotene 15,15'-dioxygenase-like n=2 Tax=Hirondellea gigas TaxID=1518452 RepID=A0A2P2HXH0_9CRUS
MATLEQFTNNAIEYPDPIPVPVTGKMPEWLKGSMLRVGPGMFNFEDFAFNHWQDGMAVMYKFTILPSGKVTFRQRFLQSDAYRKLRTLKRPFYTEFGTRSYSDPTKNIFSRMLSSFDMSSVTDNASSNVLVLSGEVFVTSETFFLRRIDPITLETREKIDLHKLTGVNFISSHPITDHDGVTYNVGSSFSTGPKYVVVRVPPTSGTSDPWSNARVLATISSTWKASMSYQHSFALSANYIVLLEQPYLVSILKLATSQAKGRSLAQCIDWFPHEKVRFVVINKHTGEVVSTKYVSDEVFFVLHNVNCYEVNNQLVLDLIAYPSPAIINKLYLDKMRNGNFGQTDHPKLKRFVLPLVDDIEDVEKNIELAQVPGCSASAIRTQDNQLGDHISLECQEIGEEGLDMPCVNPLVRGRPYRYMWGCGGFEQAFFQGAVGKIDVQTGECWSWRGSPDAMSTEAVFVRRPGGIEEDDGVLLLSTTSPHPDERDAFVVLDAKTMTEIARAEIDGRLGGSLHANFLPNKF